ncbi:N-acyl-D-glucosamine 2-epimerase [Paenibacillus sp. CMAA1739]|uniref:N-acyl-D-glucosamine 2-epimerase n=1 Tax=Paenibacillus ottowii TaxID=2315729 RepID=UPI00272F497F|nr:MULTISPECIES: N-acyl-D-glucosamine 2-epimerase [Paenibacillus]MDP1509893.1 N-acyl-D-glucosamine 2-epimerase [Paenibacillus ottowii]MEC4567277.1 N-acyl-D-glucosamine 2-epimerase [Paenibacillus sp. CMAA1739]
MDNKRDDRSESTGAIAQIGKMKPWVLNGPSIQIDPLFPYYANRSRDSIADEIALAGYQTVHYFVVRENEVDGALVAAFQRRGIAVWAMVLGNGAFSVSQLPPAWKEWRMELLREPNDGFQRLSHFAQEYVEWKKKAAARLVTDIPFDGFEVAEPYFPEWNGLCSGVYGDIGPHAQRAFRARSGEDIPNFRDKHARNYYRKVPKLYAQWVDLRVDAVNGLIRELVNSAGGVRDVRPDICVATWSLAVSGRGDIPGQLREWQGLDAVAMIGCVAPDMHVLQTHWPDWMRRRLPPQYTRGYARIAQSIRADYPDLPLGVQADIGSLARMVRDREWTRQFGAAALEGDYNAWTAYEYHLGGYMYDEPPVPLKAERSADDEVVISFSKRIAAPSVDELRIWSREDTAGATHSLGHRLRNDSLTLLELVDAAADGNRLWLRVRNLPSRAFSLRLDGVQDTPELWLLKGRKAHRNLPEHEVKVP